MAAFTSAVMRALAEHQQILLDTEEVSLSGDSRSKGSSSMLRDSSLSLYSGASASLLTSVEDEGSRVVDKDGNSGKGFDGGCERGELWNGGKSIIFLCKAFHQPLLTRFDLIRPTVAIALSQM